MHGILGFKVIGAVDMLKVSQWDWIIFVGDV